MSIDPRVRKKYCEILGVSINASKSEIKKAYYKKSLEEHPDRHGNSEESKIKFQQITNAYEKLSGGDSNEIVCLQCDKIGSPWRDSGNNQTQFCSGECYTDYRARANNNRANNNSPNNSGQCFMCRNISENFYEEWNYRGNILRFCSYMCLPNCANCYRKISKRGGCNNIILSRSRGIFCSGSCHKEFKKRENGYSETNDNWQNRQQQQQQNNTHTHTQRERERERGEWP